MKITYWNKKLFLFFFGNIKFGFLGDRSAFKSYKWEDNKPIGSELFWHSHEFTTWIYFCKMSKIHMYSLHIPINMCKLCSLYKYIYFFVGKLLCSLSKCRYGNSSVIYAIPFKPHWLRLYLCITYWKKNNVQNPWKNNNQTKILSMFYGLKSTKWKLFCINSRQFFFLSVSIQKTENILCISSIGGIYHQIITICQFSKVFRKYFGLMWYGTIRNSFPRNEIIFSKTWNGKFSPHYNYIVKIGSFFF